MGAGVCCGPVPGRLGDRKHKMGEEKFHQRLAGQHVSPVLALTVGEELWFETRGHVDKHRDSAVERTEIRDAG